MQTGLLAAQPGFGAGDGADGVAAGVGAEGVNEGKPLRIRDRGWAAVQTACDLAPDAGKSVGWQQTRQGRENRWLTRRKEMHDEVAVETGVAGRDEGAIAAVQVEHDDVDAWGREEVVAAEAVEEAEVEPGFEEEGGE